MHYRCNIHFGFIFFRWIIQKFYYRNVGIGTDIQIWFATTYYDEIIDVRPYKGDWHYNYDANVLDAIIILLSLMTKSIVSLPLYQILVYVLVPYNIVCIILFSLITIWRKQLHNYFLWCISGSICVAVILIANIFKIYEIRMLYWGIAYFITTTILGIILYSQTKIIKWEVASVWN